jgi:hypothetical protein
MLFEGKRPSLCQTTNYYNVFALLRQEENWLDAGIRKAVFGSASIARFG